MKYTLNPGINYIFATVYADYTGFSVSILESNRKDDIDEIRLHDSVVSNILSAPDIVDIIRPWTENSEPNKIFTGIYVNSEPKTFKQVFDILKCRGSVLRPSRDIERSLCDLSTRSRNNTLRTTPELKGVIESESRYLSPTDIPIRIRSLLQVIDNWCYLREGGVYLQTERDAANFRVY
jgi:hypothetical protein